VFSERIISAVMDRANARYLKLQPLDGKGYPPPRPGREYMLYVHIPFCDRLCPYCSFNRFPFEEGRAIAYFRRLRDEMRMVAELGFPCTSMYVGGGTPTIMIDQLLSTIDLGKELFDIREVSSETNPNHLIPEIVEPLAARVDRFSVGVQSFDDRLLKQMDRYDKYGSAAEILERIQSVDGVFHSLNVDMIFNFPSQTEEMLSHDIDMLKASKTNQTTFYPLMASPAVRESLRSTVGKVDYRREATYYTQIIEQLADTFTPSSAWTFERTGGGMIDEYIVDYEDYLGIGSGAFSFLEGTLFVNTFSLGEYDSLVGGGRLSTVRRRSFSRSDRMRYRFLMSLFGLALDKVAFARDFGVDVEHGLPLEMAFMRSVEAFETDDATQLTLTLKGRYLLVAMMREFFVGVNNLRDQAREALPVDERELLFGEGTASCEERAAEFPLAEAEAQAETAQEAPFLK
jgi:coproporphyrinogen III oxidase-like Fe-S oxidoreductase